MGLGLFRRIVQTECTSKTNLLLIGLDASGKTTLMHKLKLDPVATAPTIGFNVCNFEYKELNVNSWDVGGEDKIRPLYRHYYCQADAIIFMVDSNDAQRVGEAGDEFNKLVNEDELRDAVLLVLANKQDLPNCLTVPKLIDELNLRRVGRDRICGIYPTCATSGEGIYEAMEWLFEELKKKQNKVSVLQ